MKKKILVLEDDMIIAMDISMHLTKMGYEVTDILSRGEDAVKVVSEKDIDIMLVDINLKGKLDGIETVQQIQQQNRKIGIIFLTANSDKATYNRAKITKPQAFISKPFKRLELERIVELSLLRQKQEDVQTTTINESLEKEGGYILDDRIFVKHRDQIVRIFLEDILYAEAERSYCKVYTRNKEYLMTFPLKSFEHKLSSKDFLRIHRSRIINITKIDSLGDDYVLIGEKYLNVGPSFRKELLNTLKLL